MTEVIRLEGIERFVTTRRAAGEGLSEGFWTQISPSLNRDSRGLQVLREIYTAYVPEPNQFFPSTTGLFIAMRYAEELTGLGPLIHEETLEKKIADLLINPDAAGMKVEVLR